MNLVRWDPLQELDAFGAWVPPVEIFERQDQLIVRAEIPGVTKDDMEVRIENRILTLHGERKEEKQINGESAHLMERVYGSFSRSFSLPATVDATKITATYKDGVLEVTVPKVEAARPTKIEIKAA